MIFFFRKFSLELLPDKSKRTQFEELLKTTTDNTFLNQLIEYEIGNYTETTNKKLKLLQFPEKNSLNKNNHYDLLDIKHLPELNHGFLVQFCKYFEYRLRNLNSLCVMCGKRTFDSNDKRTSKVKKKNFEYLI